MRLPDVGTGSRGPFGGLSGVLEQVRSELTSRSGLHPAPWGIGPRPRLTIGSSPSDGWREPWLLIIHPGEVTQRWQHGEAAGPSDSPGMSGWQVGTTPGWGPGGLELCPSGDLRVALRADRKSEGSAHDLSSEGQGSLGVALTRQARPEAQAEGLRVKGNEKSRPVGRPSFEQDSLWSSCSHVYGAPMPARRH